MRSRRWAAVVVAGLVLVAGACGGGDDGADDAPGSSTTAGEGGTTAPTIIEGPDATAEGALDACATIRQIIEDAAAAYEEEEGEPPADQATLVDAGFMETASDDFTLEVDGPELDVVATPDGSCG